MDVADSFRVDVDHESVKRNAGWVDRDFAFLTVSSILTLAFTGIAGLRYWFRSVWLALASRGGVVLPFVPAMKVLMRRPLVLFAFLAMPWSAADAQRPLVAQSAQPQPPAQQIPRPTRTEILNFDNWSTTCQEFADSKQKTCAASIQIAAQSGQVIFIWTISFKDGHLVASFQTPTGVAISPGLELKSAKMTRTIPFESCESGHCVAAATMDPALSKDLATSQTVALSIRASNGNTVKFEVPMKGFDKALSALQKQ